MDQLIGPRWCHLDVIKILETFIPIYENGFSILFPTQYFNNNQEFSVGYDMGL